MTSTDPLEGRLRALSLELPERGDHLDDERLAEFAEGADPIDAEAAHLAGCDACCEVLLLLGDGLAEWTESEAAAKPAVPTASVHAFPSRGRRGRWSTAGLVLAFASAAAAAWGVYTLALDRPEDTAPGAETMAPSPHTPAPAVTPKVEIEETVAAPTTAAVEKAIVESAPQAVATSEPAPMSASAPEVTATEVAPAMPKARPRKKSPKGLSLPTVDGPPWALSGRSGPRPVNRMPVNGAPRGFGALRLNAKPSALVYVDGKAYGWTPLLNLRLQAGPHDVRLVYKSPLAADKEQRFRVLIQEDETWSTVRDNRLRK